MLQSMLYLVDIYVWESTIYITHAIFSYRAVLRYIVFGDFFIVSSFAAALFLTSTGDLCALVNLMIRT